ncbi:hypothetical protein A2671_00755 [Candidatus Kaiserbacteria bacterium RIFCSPHIGHO2_01_FULL_49_13]|uniref:Uncharacterized protein n=1 Tax=Candidatus Kaiserbacteria bacterium RIFCSPHIGHO2_01_FULL_49_13 TaxID=1798477 RepID=A0A1F6CE65_9BACT|nr:MAG: hypothetical protein A2671_00755 [Candidatus Kaiserbacteria bacterium RIFCSPHIGHO2_01_FULL_49_13]
MTNLLPEEEKRALEREYILRLSAVCLGMATGVVLIGIAGLMPAFLFLQEKRVALETQVQAVDEYLKTQGTERVTAEFRSISSKVAILDVLRKTIDTPEFIDGIIAARPSGVTLTGVVLSQSGAVGKITLEGFAARRTDLATFVETLQNTKHFTSVDFPISNLADSENLTFSITAVGSW